MLSCHPTVFSLGARGNEMMMTEKILNIYSKCNRINDTLKLKLLRGH